MINNFIQIFADILSTGIDRLSTVILVIMSLLAAIDLCIAYVFEYSDNMQNVIKLFITRIIRYGGFFILAKSYKIIIDNLIDIFFKVGYLFFPNMQSTGKVGFPDFDEIYSVLLKSILNLAQEMESLSFGDIGKKLIYLFLILLGVLCIVFILKEIIIGFIEFRLISVVGIILIPFGVLEFTKSIFQKLPHALLLAGARLTIAVSLTGVSLRVIERYKYTSSPGELSIGNAILWIFLMGLCAFLISGSKEMASMLINGTPASNTGVFGKALSMGAGMITGGIAGSVVGGNAAITGFKQGRNAYKRGENLKSVLSSVHKGIKDGADKITESRIAKIGKRVDRGIQNTIAYGTGQRDLSNVARDLWGATGGLVGEQIMFEKEPKNKKSNYNNNYEKENEDNLTQPTKKETRKTTNNKKNEFYTYEEVERAINKAKEDILNPNKKKMSETPEAEVRRHREVFDKFKKQYKKNSNKTTKKNTSIFD